MAKYKRFSKHPQAKHKKKHKNSHTRCRVEEKGVAYRLGGINVGLKDNEHSRASRRDAVKWEPQSGTNTLPEHVQGGIPRVVGTPQY